MSGVVTADDDTSVVDEINITVPVSCTLSGTGQNSHDAEINNGQYDSAIGETTLKAYCNDNEGFAIYAIGYTDDEEGKNVLTNSTLGSTYDIVTGTATSGNTSNWAMKLSTITSPAPTYPIIIAGTSADTLKEQGDPDFTTFQAVPDDYTKVAYRTSSTDIGTNAEGSTLKTTYQAYISSTQPAGTYTGQVKYTMVNPYSAAAPEKPATTIEDAFAAAGKTKYNGYYKIQDMTSAICATVDQYSGDGMAEVIDVRDNNTYHIAKLADDNCWMLDNLVLDPTDSTTAANMSASNTNATQEAITNLLNGGSSTTGWGSAAVADVDTSFDSYTTPMINNASKDTLVDGYGLASVHDQAKKVGIYYNYCAASASTYCYASGSGVDVPSTIIDAPQDICPANWRMPTGGNTGEYKLLAQEYGYIAEETNSLQYNLSTPLSGYYSSEAEELDFYGYWWSSTYAGDRTMRVLSVVSEYVYEGDSCFRSLGIPMRCLVSE